MEKYLFGLEYFKDLVHPNKRIMPKTGHITKITLGGKEINTVVINGETKELPAKVEAGDMINLNDGDIAVLEA